MSFAASSTDVVLYDGHILRASCRNADGEWVESTLDLNDFIGNSDGWFAWDGEKFGETARNVRLEGNLLTADLPKRDGGYRERQGIDLNERISNEDGQLVFV